MKYSEKLRDPRWQKKRLEVMQRDGFACLACSDTTRTLNVHHKQYRGNPWEAKMEMLETLCESCHERRTNLNNSFLELPSKVAFARFSGEVETERSQNLRAQWDEILRFLRIDSTTFPKAGSGEIWIGEIIDKPRHQELFVHTALDYDRMGKELNYGIAHYTGWDIWVTVEKAIF